MIRPLWWVAIGLSVVAVAGFAHSTGSVNPLIAAPGGPLQQLPQASATQVMLHRLVIDGISARSAVVGNGGSVMLEAGYAVQSAVAHPQVSVRVERKVGAGAWTATSTNAVTTSGDALSVWTPAFSTSAATQTVQYRLASDSSQSVPVSVVYENQQRYTGMAATIYQYAASFCPNTAVHMADLDASEAGEYRPGTMLILVDRKVGVSVNLSTVNQHALAMHECSHELQWLNYGGTPTGYRAMETAAATYFSKGDNGAAPLEHAADCGAIAVVPDGYLGYGGYCSATEVDAARRLLGGQRY